MFKVFLDYWVCEVVCCILIIQSIIVFHILTDIPMVDVALLFLFSSNQETKYMSYLFFLLWGMVFVGFCFFFNKIMDFLINLTTLIDIRFSKIEGEKIFMFS